MKTKRPTASDLKRHPMFSQSDFDYLRGKGYTLSEIRDLWDRDHKQGAKPVVHAKPFDIVRYLATH